MTNQYDPREIHDADLVDMIVDDFTFPIRQPSGENVWYISNDIKSKEHAQQLLVREKLARLAAKTKAPAFEIERTMQGAVLKNVSVLGHLFSQTLCLPRLDPVPEQYEASERLQLMARVEKEQGLRDIAFAINPLVIIGLSGFMEGDAVNAFCIRLGEGSNRIGIRDRFRARVDATRKHFNMVSRFFGRHIAPLRQPQCIELRLFYLASDNPPKPKDSFSDLTRFLRELRADEALAYAGDFWKRQNCSEAGDNYRVLMIFDGQLPPFARLDALWANITEGRGIGIVTKVFDIYSDEMAKHLRCMFVRDQILRLKAPEGVPLFSTGGALRREKPVSSPVNTMPPHDCGVNCNV